MQPVNLIQLTTHFQIPKYLEIREGEFKLGGMDTYFFGGELRHWLTAIMHINEGIAIVTSEPINVHQYHKYRSEFNKLFYDLIKEARLGLKELRPKDWFFDQAAHYEAAAKATEGETSVSYANLASYYRKTARKIK